MNILIVGGTGLTGAHAALHLHHLGHNITLMARKPPALDCLAGFGFIAGDYLKDDIDERHLGGFDALVFAAGADLRMLPDGDNADHFFHQANAIATPRFFARAKACGIGKAIYIGSWYAQVAPWAIACSAYVRSRHQADIAVRALSDDHFMVCSLNAPFIIGHVPGLVVPHLQALALYAAGRLPGIPVVAPAGGVNHISSQSMSEAIAALLEHGRGGTAYLAGDENLSWKDYLECWFAAAGNPQALPLTADEHPLLPDIILYAGRNREVYIAPDSNTLPYCRGQIRQTIAEVAAACLHG